MQKRLLNFITICLISMGAYAQNLVYSPSQSVTGVVEGKVNEYTIRVTTPSPEAITFAWKKIKNTFPGDWDFSLCDHNNCYIGLPNSGEMFSISQSEAEGGAQGFFKLNILGAEAEGSGEIQIYVYDKDDYSRGDTVSFKVTKGTASVISKRTTSIDLVPNPASNAVSVTIDEPNTIISLYSLNGILVKQFTPSTLGDFTLDISDLSNGMYTLQMKSDDVLQQGRLVVQH